LLHAYDVISLAEVLDSRRPPRSALPGRQVPASFGWVGGWPRIPNWTAACTLDQAGERASGRRHHGGAGGGGAAERRAGVGAGPAIVWIRVGNTSRRELLTWFWRHPVDSVSITASWPARSSRTMDRPVGPPGGAGHPGSPRSRMPRVHGRRP